MSSNTIVISLQEETAVAKVTNCETIIGLKKLIQEVYKIPVEEQQIYVSRSSYSSAEDPERNEALLESFFGEKPSSWISDACGHVDEILFYLAPTTASVSSRKAIIEFIKKTLNKCLGARVFGIGSFMNQIFLPDEVLELTPFLCKGQEEKWHMRVNEGLYGVKATDIELKSVTFDLKTETILVDVNDVTLSLYPNELHALYIGAMLDDICSHFGGDDIVKRTILLVKAWCHYDCTMKQRDGKTIVSSLLAPTTLHMMVLHLFTKYCNIIITPLHGLVSFLHYYSNFNFHDHIISLPRLLDSLTLEPIDECDNSAIIDSIIASHRDRYHATVAASKKSRQDEPTDTSESMEAARNILQPVARGKAQGAWTNQSMGVIGHSLGPVTGGDLWSPLFQTPYETPLETPYETPDRRSPTEFLPLKMSYRRSYMNILDPMRDTNLAGNLTSEQVDDIKTSFQCGYHFFLHVIGQCNDISNGGEENYIPLDVNIFQNGAKSVDIGAYFVAQALGNTSTTAVKQKRAAATATPKIEHAVEETDDAESCIRHAELIMGSKITADAVANLIVHIIEQVGPHPIGEVGKLLQDATGNPNLSKVLKTQFRGLKKLIEGFPHMLRLGGDHTFNPHVYLADGMKQSVPDNTGSFASSVNSTYHDDATLPTFFDHGAYQYDELEPQQAVSSKYFEITPPSAPQAVKGNVHFSQFMMPQGSGGNVGDVSPRQLGGGRGYEQEHRVMFQNQMPNNRGQQQQYHQRMSMPGRAPQGNNRQQPLRSDSAVWIPGHFANEQPQPQMQQYMRQAPPFTSHNTPYASRHASPYNSQHATPINSRSSSPVQFRSAGVVQGNHFQQQQQSNNMMRSKFVPMQAQRVSSLDRMAEYQTRRHVHNSMDEGDSHQKVYDNGTLPPFLRNI